MLADFASGDVVIIVVVVAILIFGSAKIPKIARGLGSAKSEFEKGIKEGQASTEDHSSDKPAS
jgi:sec-independent protein translocase protein TatA